jgi:hypothetical protein
MNPKYGLYKKRQEERNEKAEKKNFEGRSRLQKEVLLK